MHGLDASGGHALVSISTVPSNARPMGPTTSLAYAVLLFVQNPAGQHGQGVGLLPDQPVQRRVDVRGGGLDRRHRERLLAAGEVVVQHGPWGPGAGSSSSARPTLW
jgi:hypothetical protein